MTSEGSDAAAPATTADEPSPEEAAVGPPGETPPETAATAEAVSPVDPEGEEEPPEPPVIPQSVLALRRTRKALWIAVAVALPVAMLVAVLATRPSARSREVQSPLVGRPAPGAEGATIDGSRASLADLRGQWVVVNFFATWCVPCRTEHPELMRFAEAHREAGDASVFAVVYSDSPSAVRDYRAEHGGDWPMLTDPDGRIALDFGVRGIPESFLVSPEGFVVSKITGGVRAADLERLLAQAGGGA
ncbi:MAG TPA: TlpA disulfide reductase family protein [Acidimicrobiales bacterium]|nr:TlpA disulfide reductase family protein [Acidimicrobiales bacterium]